MSGQLCLSITFAFVTDLPGAHVDEEAGQPKPRVLPRRQLTASVGQTSVESLPGSGRRVSVSPPHLSRRELQQFPTPVKTTLAIREEHGLKDKLRLKITRLGM